MHRLNYLDALRSGAMLVVVLWHVTGSWPAVQPLGPTTMSVIQWPMGLSRWSLVLFFMMAGYFGALLHARWGTARFVRDRLLRIGVPLLVGLVTIVPLTWLIIHRWSLCNLGRRWLAADRPALRYVADSSYWIYLMHLPLALVLILLIAPLGLPFPVAWLLVAALLFSILLGLYELVVRHSVVGKVLNGPRAPRGWGRRRPGNGRVPEGASG